MRSLLGLPGQLSSGAPGVQEALGSIQCQDYSLHSSLPTPTSEYTVMELVPKLNSCFLLCSSSLKRIPRTVHHRYERHNYKSFLNSVMGTEEAQKSYPKRLCSRHLRRLAEELATKVQVPMCGVIRLHLHLGSSLTAGPPAGPTAHKSQLYKSSHGAENGFHLSSHSVKILRTKCTPLKPHGEV